MTTEELDYLKKLEECFECVGKEFHERGGDSCFWWEADIEGRLLSCL